MTARFGSPETCSEGSPASSQRRWWRGWLRLTVAAYVIAWLGTWIWLSRDTARNAELLLFRHLSPTWSQFEVLRASSWYTVAASTDYLAMTPDAQRARAASFYDTEMAGLARELYYDAKGFRETFVRASINAPVQEWTGGVKYRDMTFYGYPGRDLARLTRDAALLGLAVNAAVLVPLFLVASGIRWVVRGFKGD